MWSIPHRAVGARIRGCWKSKIMSVSMHRAPTTNMLLAKRSLEAGINSDVVAWATDQMVNGSDSRHLRHLAGFTGQENTFEIEETFDHALNELGIRRPSSNEAILLYARELAGEFIDGVIHREHLLHELSQLYIAGDYLSILNPFYNLRWAIDDIKERGWSFYSSDATAENFDELLRAEATKLFELNPNDS